MHPDRPRLLAPQLACLLALPLLASACGKSKPAPGADPTAQPAQTQSVAEPLTGDDLLAVCTGKAEPRAKAYSKTDASVHSMVTYLRRGTADKFAEDNVSALRRFEPEKPEATELVACVTRKDEKKIATCDFDSKQPVHYLDMHEATFDIAIREAKTGAEVATKTVTLPSRGCPSMHMFSSERENDYPNSDFVLIEMASAVLLPPSAAGELKFPNADALRSKLSDYELAAVCYGIPEPRAVPLTKTPGQISPAIVLARTSANDEYSKVYDSDLDPWKTEDPQQYQIVVCASEKTRTKKKECKFDDQKPVHILDLYSATYDVTVREARTAKVLATKTVSEAADGVCPTMHFFNSLHDLDIPKATKPIMALAAPFAAPK